MPLEKQKLKAERKRFARLSSGMFLMLLVLIGVLVYVSVSNVNRAKEIERKDKDLKASNEALRDSTIALQQKKKELEFANLALEIAEANYESFVDSIIKVSRGAEKEAAMQVKQQSDHLAQQIIKDKQTQEDLKDIQRLGDALDGKQSDLTQEEWEKTEMEYEEIQRRNPVIDAVVKANERKVKKESDMASQEPSADRPERDMPNRNKYAKLTSVRDAWLKEGYFHTYNEANKLKVFVESLQKDKAKITCSFLEESEFPAWTFTIEEGDRKTFEKGDLKILFSFKRTGAAGKNPLKKALFYNLYIAKKS
ncbi:MAG: hypothetical protein AAF696_16960 [Bacteroidota bacterium]